MSPVRHTLHARRDEDVYKWNAVQMAAACTFESYGGQASWVDGSQKDAKAHASWVDESQPYTPLTGGSACSAYDMEPERWVFSLTIFRVKDLISEP